jgi:hypothetical protein
VLKTTDASIFVEMMATIPFFPVESAARSLITDELRGMCRNWKEADWLVQRMVRLYNSWPGLAEMRRVYCASKIPLDGVAAMGLSEYFGDGIIPPEHPEPERAPVAALPAGAVTSADPQLDNAVRELAEAKRLPAPHERFPIAVTPPKIAETREQRHFTPITQADIDKAVAEYRQKKSAEIDERARKESGL